METKGADVEVSNEDSKQIRCLDLPLQYHIHGLLHNVFD